MLWDCEFLGLEISEYVAISSRTESPEPLFFHFKAYTLTHEDSPEMNLKKCVSRT